MNQFSEFDFFKPAKTARIRAIQGMKLHRKILRANLRMMSVQWCQPNRAFWWDGILIISKKRFKINILRIGVIFVTGVPYWCGNHVFWKCCIIFCVKSIYSPKRFIFHVCSAETNIGTLILGDVWKNLYFIIPLHPSITPAVTSLHSAEYRPF